MNELQKLYDVLVREGKYTKSFDDFQQKWSQEEAYRDKVYGVVSRDGLYTKDKDSFLQKYFASAETTVASTVKKKEPTQQAGALGAMPSPLRSSADEGSFGGYLSQVGQKAQGMQRKPVLPLRPIEDRIQEESSKIGSFNQSLNQRKAQLAEMQASMGLAPTQEQAQTYNKIAGEFNSELVKANEEQKKYNNLIDEYSSQSNSPTFASNFQDLMKDTQRYEMPIPAPKEVGTWENIWNNLANGNDTAWRSLGTFVARGSGAALGMGAMDAMGTMADLALSKYYPANRAVKGSEEMNMAEASVASFAQSAPIMAASMATGIGGAALAGRVGMRALGSIPMFVTGFEQGIKNADEAGVTGLDKYNYATLNGAFEAISEMILPDAQLIKPLKDKLFKDIIRQGAKGLSKEDVARYTADFAAKGGLEFGEELFVDLTSMLTDYAYGSALGIEELTPEMKSAREYGIMAMSSMIGAGIFSTVSSANDALSAKKSAIVAASDNVGLANQTTMQLLEEGVLTEVQAAEFMASVEAVAAVRGRIPSMVGADAIVDTAPLIEQKTAIDAQIADLEIQKAQADDAYQPMLQQQIDALKGQREQLNEQIQAVITPQAESAAVELEMPSIERILEDLDNGKVVTFQYEKESDIPIEFRDKVSSFGEVNGKKNFNVTMAESLANYYLSKQNAQQPTTQQEAATPQAQQQNTAAGEVASPVAEQAGAVVEGVQEGGVDTRIANSPLAEVVNKRGVITDANGNLVEGDVYVDGERVVLEAGGRIYDTLGSIDELSQMTAEQLPVQVVAPRITATEGGFTYNSSEGAMPQGTRITPQGKGLKAVKRDKNGNVKSVVVKDDAGNTFNLKGEDAQAMAFELMMDEISKGNLDAKIVLNDEAATAINTAGRPATTQAADSGATQADATRQGAATPTTATERGDGGRGRRGDGGGRGRGGRVEATQETEAKPKAKPDAAKKPSTEGVDARKQAEDGEGVGKEDSKGKEAAQETQPQSKAKDIEQQVADFGTQEADVKPVSSVISRVFDTLKQAGLTSAKTVGDWIGIGRGSEKPYSLKINGEDVNVKSVQPEVIAGFYSPLEKVISETKLDKLPAKQWIDKFAKGEEAKLTGLKDWLAQQQGSVSKADIQRYLKYNRIRVVEVVRGEGAKDPWTQEGTSFFSKDRRFQIKDLGDNEYEVIKDGRFNLGSFDGLDTAKERAVENGYANEDDITNETKFALYQLEGEKENYKEVLVLLPSKSSLDDLRGFFNSKDKKGKDFDKLTRDEFMDLQDEYRKSKQFKSHHFDEPNILVHLRMNTRTAADGSKVLFLEELQSDWGQQGKKEGFQKPENNFTGKDYDRYNELIEKANKSDLDVSEIKMLEDKMKLSNKQQFFVPTAPFVTDTNSWVKLGLKVALKEAVKQGADKIAWTTGEQQNERYNLKKDLNYLDYWKNDNGTYGVTLDFKNPQEFTRPSELTERELVDYFGKEIASKIVLDTSFPTEDNPKRLQGDDLAVGGKGMKGFYGSPTEGSLGIVGNVAKSLSKQEPKTVEIDSGNKYTPSEVEKIKGVEFIVRNQDGTKTAFERLEYAEEYIMETGGVLENTQKLSSTQHSIDITPELKASVEGGQPLFKDAEAQYRIESGKNIVEAIKDFNGSQRATVALTHEIMHPTVVAIIDGAKDGNNVGAKHTQTIVDEFNKANPKNKITVEQLIEGNDAFKNGSTSEQYRAVQEFIAESWEQYNLEGKQGFSKAFQDVLDQITKAFQAVYKAVSGKELTPELRRMFDEILGKPKGKEAVQEGEVADKPKTPKEMLAEVRDRKKAAIDVLKKQWNDAKNTGISTNFEQRLKDDKAFFGAIRDIIQSNIEIGALKITDSLNDIADALGIKLSKADKDAVKGVFNKEVLRSLKSAQAEMFETEVVREALGEYIEENKQVLKGAANAQALKLVNEASTEDGFNRALKYIDKLINDTQFREAVDAASNAVSNVKPKLTRLGVSRGVVDFLSGVKVSSLEDVNILSKLAKILKSPADFNIADVTALASEVQNYLEQNAKENVPTQKDVENRIKKLLSSRERNAEGEMQDVPKTFDTPRKIQELAKSIAKAESEIMRLDINDDERAALLEQLKPAMQELSNAQSNLAEAVQAFTEQNIDASKQMVEAIKRGDIVVDEQSQEAMGLIALGKDPSLMDGLSYYESQKLADGLQEIANGYTPLGFFKSVSADIINKPQREGIGLLEKQATAQTKANAEAMDKNGGLIGMARMAFDTLRGGKKFAKSAQKARAGKQEKSDIKILAEMVTRGLVQIDTMYNLVKSTPVRKSIILPLVRAYNAYQTDVEQTTNSFRRKAGLSAVAPNTAARVKRNNKVGFVLLQESENANRGKYNMLAETAKYYESMREKEIGVPIEERVAAIELAEQFPNGITKEDLTESELKIYEAFRELMDNNLESKARMSALTAGTPWERLQAYAPYLRADRSSAYGATGTKETESDLMALMEAKGDSPKNPKVMSDRNLQRDPNAAFFAPIANVVTMANIATNEVMKQYHMQPTLFATMRALNGIIGDTNSSVVKALKQAYIGEVSLKMSGYTKPILKGISGFSNTLVGTKLANFNRIAGEVSAGLLQFGKTISLSKMPEFSVLLPNFGVKDKLDGEFGGSLLARGGVKDMRSKVDKGKEIYNRLLSPDEINMSMYRTAAFKYVMMQAFRESTGKALDYGKITDAEYFDANRAELKKAYDKAIAEALPVYDKSGIGRQYAVRFPFSGRAVLNASKSENNRLAFSMAMLFGRYASASGNDTVLSMASAFGTNKDTPLTERVKASTAMKKMLFTIGEGMVYTAAIDIFVASVEAFSSDDEEEKERIWNDLRKSYTDPRKLIAAGMGSMLYFGTGVYGVFGKIMSYTSLAVVKAGYDYLYKDSKEITKSEYDSVVGNLSKTSSDMFYMPLAKSERELEQNILQMAAGGIGFLGKETASVAQSFGQFGEEVMKDAERALNGEELEGLDAMNALYALGIVVNHLGRPIGVQVPFIENARRASRNVESLKESSDPDKIARAEKIDNAKALRLINNYADITLNEEFKGNPDALEENKSKLEESLQRIGLSEEKVENRLKSFEKKYNEKKYPIFMYNIIKETSPKAAAVRAANAYEELAADMADALNKGNAKKANELEETISAFREMLYDKKMSKIEFEDEFYARLSAKGIEY